MVRYRFCTIGSPGFHKVYGVSVVSTFPNFNLLNLLNCFVLETFLQVFVSHCLSAINSMIFLPAVLSCHQRGVKECAIAHCWAVASGGWPKRGVWSKNSQGSPLWLRRGPKKFVKGGVLPFFARTTFRGGPRPLGPNGPGATVAGQSSKAANADSVVGVAQDGWKDVFIYCDLKTHG